MLIVAGQRQQLFQLVPIGRRVPRRDGPFANRLVGVGHDQRPDRSRDVAKALARRASAERAIEAQPPRLGVGKWRWQWRHSKRFGEIEPLPSWPSTIDARPLEGRLRWTPVRSLNVTCLDQRHGSPVRLARNAVSSESRSRCTDSWPITSRSTITEQLVACECRSRLDRRHPDGSSCEPRDHAAQSRLPSVAPAPIQSTRRPSAAPQTPSSAACPRGNAPAARRLFAANRSTGSSARRADEAADLRKQQPQSSRSFRSRCRSWPGWIAKCRPA